MSREADTGEGATLPFDLSGVKSDPSGTLVPQPSGEHALGVDALPELGVVAEEAPSLTGPVPQLRMGNVVGEGGGGVVRWAIQLPLERRVAVKQLHASADAVARTRLLREAVATGTLEHPNVVPLYALGKDDRSEPMMVMKYIEGRRWSDLLRDAAEEQRPLEDHLAILTQVCNAVHFAHARGIVHRDIKPDNVMIGSFGEIYLLDWGLAVGLLPEHRGRLPLAEEVGTIAGTPGYMAPEMVRARARIDERTDVYLLGATLHEIVTGRRLHEGGSITARLQHALDPTSFRYDRDVPREVVAIIAQATSPDPIDRYPSAEAFRDAIAGFLQHRSSLELAAEATERLDALRSRVHAEGGEAGPAEIHALGIEARFGFSQALRAWPGNAEARAGLAALRALLFDHAVDRENLEGARALLAEMEVPGQRAERLRRLEKRLAERAGKAAELDRLLHATDLTKNALRRKRMSMVLGAVLVIMIGGLGTLRALGLHETGYPDVVAVLVVFAIAIGVASRWPSATDIDHKLRLCLATTPVALLAHVLGCWALGLELTATLALAMLLMSMPCLVLGILVHRVMHFAAAAYFLTFAVITAFPRARPLALLVGNGAAFGAMAIMSARIRAEAERHAPSSAPSSAARPR
jgi:serine/threonine-protein kinase